MEYILQLIHAVLLRRFFTICTQQTRHGIMTPDFRDGGKGIINQGGTAISQGKHNYIVGGRRAKVGNGALGCDPSRLSYL